VIFEHARARSRGEKREAGGSGGKYTTRRGVGVGPGPDLRAAPRPVGGAPTTAWSWLAWAARFVSNRSGRRQVADTRDPAVSGRGRDEREARGARGPTRKRTR
jgi:hypothetical protein